MVEKLGAKGIHVEQISHAYALARVLIHVSWPDAALRAIDLIRASLLFLQAIQQEMIGHDYVRSLADVESRNINARAP